MDPIQNAHSPQPLEFKEPKLNIRKTQEIIKVLEEKLRSKVIVYYVDIESSITQSHPDIFMDVLQDMGEQESVSLIIVSPGGSATAALRISSILREYCKNLQVVVPSMCASAATVLSLAADKIIMSPAGYLTAIDSSIRHDLNPVGADRKPIFVSVDQVKRVIKFLNDEGPAQKENGLQEGAYRTLFKYLHPLAFGEIDRNSSASTMIAVQIMKMHPEVFGDEEKINWIANYLVNDYPLHVFPILFSEARKIGLPAEKADKDLSKVLSDLTKLYSNTTVPKKTHINELYYHLIGYPVLIETLNRRVAFRFSYDKKFIPLMRNWQVENDTTQWVNLFPPEKEGDPWRTVPLDYQEPQKEPVVSNPNTIVPNSATENPVPQSTTT